MSQISSFLKLEVSKYKDIDHILKKLEDDGEVKNIYDVFKTIFDNEFAFTYQELLKIQDTKKETINMKKQCENNLTLFKNNLNLIVQMIVDKALKNTLNQNKGKVVEVQESSVTNNEELSETGLFSVTASPLSPIGKIQDSKIQNRGRLVQSPIRDQILSASFHVNSVSTKNAENRLNALNSSNIDSPLAQILDRTHSPSRIKEVVTINNLNQNRVSRQSSSPNKHSRSSLLQRDSSNNSRSSFVQSEFNHITGSAKFTRSPRSKEKIDLNPGPGSYEPVDLRHSPSARFEKSPKVCWFDQQVARNESPGPHLNPSHHYLSK